MIYYLLNQNSWNWVSILQEACGRKDVGAIRDCCIRLKEMEGLIDSEYDEMEEKLDVM